MIEVTELPKIAAIAQLVRGYSSRVRTGIVLLKPHQIGMEHKLAIQNQLGFVNYQQYKLSKLHPEQRFLGLTAQSLLSEIDTLLSEDHTHNAILLSNTDLVLARLSNSERNSVWKFLMDSLAKRHTGLVIAMPQSAQQLLPTIEEFARWQKENRIGQA